MEAVVVRYLGSFVAAAPLRLIRLNARPSGLVRADDSDDAVAVAFDLHWAEAMDLAESHDTGRGKISQRVKSDVREHHVGRHAVGGGTLLSPFP